MFSRIKSNPSFSFKVNLIKEKRLIAETVGSDTSLTECVYDSSQLDLGTAEIYDLENMLKAGVQPGKAVPHDVPVMDAIEIANQYAAAVESATIVESNE